MQPNNNANTVKPIPRWFYVFIRQDMPVHQQLIQATHAGIMAAKWFGVPEYHHLVVCGVPDYAVLNRVEDHLNEVGIRYYTFFEPDNDLGLTALCTESVEKKYRKFLGMYPLWQASGYPWTEGFQLEHY